MKRHGYIVLLLFLTPVVILFFSCKSKDGSRLSKGSFETKHLVAEKL